MAVDVRHLRYFVAVAEDLQFSSAARRLDIAQSTLSETIQRLERDLGTVLFERSTRSVSLTAAGARLLSEAREVLATLERSLAGLAGTDRPRLRLGASTAARAGILEALLDRHARTSPGAGLSVCEQASGALIRDLAGYRLDVCLTFCTPARDGFNALRLADEPLLIALPAAHPRVGASDLALTDLMDLPLVLYEGDEHAGYNAAAQEACRAEGADPGIVRIPHCNVHPSFVRTGGFMLWPAVAAKAPRAGIGYATPATAATLPFDLMWRDEPLPSALSEFLAAGRAVAGDAPWRHVQDVGALAGGQLRTA